MRLSSSKPTLSWLVSGMPVNKKNQKNKIDEEDHEAGLADLTVDAPATGELSIPAPKPKP